MRLKDKTLSKNGITVHLNPMPAARQRILLLLVITCDAGSGNEMLRYLSAPQAGSRYQQRSVPNAWWRRSASHNRTQYDGSHKWSPRKYPRSVQQFYVAQNFTTYNDNEAFVMTNRAHGSCSVHPHAVCSVKQNGVWKRMYASREGDGPRTIAYPPEAAP